MLSRRDRARSGFGLFLTGSGFAERVVQCDVNVAEGMIAWTGPGRSAKASAIGTNSPRR